MMAAGLLSRVTGSSGGVAPVVEAEAAAAPGEDLVELRLHLAQQRPLQVVGRQRPHLHQDLALVALLPAHAAQRLLQHVGLDQPAGHQDLTQALAQLVRAHRYRVAVAEIDDFLGLRRAPAAARRSARRRRSAAGGGRRARGPASRAARRCCSAARAPPARPRAARAAGPGPPASPPGSWESSWPRGRAGAAPSPAAAPAGYRSRPGWSGIRPGRTGGGPRCGVWPPGSGWR